MGAREQLSDPLVQAWRATAIARVPLASGAAAASSAPSTTLAPRAKRATAHRTPSAYKASKGRVTADAAMLAVKRIRPSRSCRSFGSVILHSQSTA